MSSMSASPSTYGRSRGFRAAVLRLAAASVLTPLLALMVVACSTQSGRGGQRCPSGAADARAVGDDRHGVAGHPEVPARTSDGRLRPPPGSGADRAEDCSECVRGRMRWDWTWPPFVGTSASAHIQPWTGTRFDGRESCILLRTDAGSVFRYMGCVPARICSLGRRADRPRGRRGGRPADRRPALVPRDRRRHRGPATRAVGLAHRSDCRLSSIPLRMCGFVL